MITIGIDEVGRGCWAGPLVAGAVVLGDLVPGLADSKVLNRHKRERLSEDILKTARAVGIGWVTAEEVDEVGVTEAVRLAMERAVSQIKIDYDELIVDGNINYFLNNLKAKAVVKADANVPAVSAASIVAKVARDNYMTELSVSDYPGYGFEQHVGYGTALHIAKLKELGVSNIHRKSYKPIKGLLQ